MLAWSFEEAGKIIETYKVYETKPADLIMEKSESYPYLQVNLISKYDIGRLSKKTFCVSHI